MKLTIVIPAYNEEQSIGSIIERTLAARPAIIERSPVSDVEVIVVSDGSTDRTATIAAGYDQIQLITFPRNRGYGAAIKKGFEQGTGQIVGFLDADGTCDPLFFATLCRALVRERAAIALGSRLGPQSRMPRLRRIGNRVYAFILSALSNRVVTDTASGMRVIRREALDRLYPLPDGLHFTPAMSARALMDDRLRIVECPMPYEEREGESKLHVVKDGVRFLHTILNMTLMWRPAKLFVMASAVCFATMTLFAMHPIETWWTQGLLREDVVYRLLFCWFVGATGMTLLSTGVVCEHLRRLFAADSSALGAPTFVWTVLDRVFSWRGVAMAGTTTLPLLGWLVGGGVWSWITTGYVHEHWSRVVLAGLVALGLGQMTVTVLVLTLIRFHTTRAGHRSSGAVSASAQAVTAPSKGKARAVPALGAPDLG